MRPILLKNVYLGSNASNNPCWIVIVQALDIKEINIDIVYHTARIFVELVYSALNENQHIFFKCFFFFDNLFNFHFGLSLK